MKTLSNQRLYTIKRYVVETYEIYATSRQKALKAAISDPGKVEIIKETCKPQK